MCPDISYNVASCRIAQGVYLCDSSSKKNMSLSEIGLEGSCQQWARARDFIESDSGSRIDPDSNLLETSTVIPDPLP